MFGKKKKGKKGEEAEAEASAPPPAAEKEEGAEGEAPSKKKLPMKLIAVAAAGLIVVVGGGGTGAWMFMSKGKSGDGAEHAEKDKGKAKAKSKGGHGGGAGGALASGATLTPGPDHVWYYAMPTMQTNLQSTDGRPNHLSVKIVLELTDEAHAEVIEEQIPRVRDLLQTFLRELRPEDLNGSQGNMRLHQEIRRRVNLVIAPAEVNTVLLQELLQT